MADKKDKRTPATAANQAAKAAPDAPAEVAKAAEIASGLAAPAPAEAASTPAEIAAPGGAIGAIGIGEALVAQAAAAKPKRGRKGEKADAPNADQAAPRRWRKPRPIIADDATAEVAAVIGDRAADALAEGKGVGEALVSPHAATPRRRGRPRNPPLPPGEKPARPARPAGDKPRRRYQPGRQRVPPGYLVTGVRVDERLSPMLLALARQNGTQGGRSASLTSIACAAMRTFAAMNGVELSEVDISPSRRDDEVLGDRASRRLWVKYPEAWQKGIAELMDRNPALNHAADLWRSALVEFARASGVAA